MSENICYNFLVCKGFHEKRTIPLYAHIDKHLNKELNSKIFLIGGFNTFDKIPIVKLSNTDDYLSCINKLLYIFDYHSHSEFDWYFIGDDDTYINKKELLNFLPMLSKDALEIHGRVSPSDTQEFGTIPHIHGGSGILMNAKTFFKLGEFILNNNFSIRDVRYSDVTLAMNVYCYNQQNSEPINLVNNLNMHREEDDVLFIDYNKLITLHLKDRVSFRFMEAITQYGDNLQIFFKPFKNKIKELKEDNNKLHEILIEILHSK